MIVSSYVNIKCASSVPPTLCVHLGSNFSQAPIIKYCTDDQDPEKEKKWIVLPGSLLLPSTDVLSHNSWVDIV